MIFDAASTAIPRYLRVCFYLQAELRCLVSMSTGKAFSSFTSAKMPTQSCRNTPRFQNRQEANLWAPSAVLLSRLLPPNSYAPNSRRLGCLQLFARRRRDTFLRLLACFSLLASLDNILLPPLRLEHEWSKLSLKRGTTMKRHGT
jgi:hypothetical protein